MDTTTHTKVPQAQAREKAAPEPIDTTMFWGILCGFVLGFMSLYLAGAGL